MLNNHNIGFVQLCIKYLNNPVKLLKFYIFLNFNKFKQTIPIRNGPKQQKEKNPTQRLSPQSGIGHHANGAPDNPNNKDQETSPDKDNPKDEINPNPTSSQLTTENIVNEPNQLIEERMVMGLPSTPWVEEQHSQHETRRAQGTPSVSGRRVISKTDLRSRALPRSDRASDRASRSNYNMIEDHVEDDTNDRHSRSIQELEDEAQS